jgi:benzoyl-CoA reductase subunit C
MKTIDEFKILVSDRHERLRALKKEGTRIIAYTCNDIPVEIIAAAGAMPMRVLSAPGAIQEAGTYVQHFFCHYMRSFLELGLQGVYDYVEGFVGTHTCDAILSGYEHWKRYVPTAYTWFLQAPIVTDKPFALEFFVRELERFRDSLSEYTGNKITDKTLRSCIDLYNTNRALLREVYALRKGSRPLISGYELQQVMLAGLTMPVDAHNQLLRELLSELPERIDPPDGKFRLMLVGGPIDESELLLLREIEHLGGIIVADDTCTGSQYLNEDIEDTEKPLAAVASRYLKKVSCPVKAPSGPRFDHVLKMADVYDVQGVIFILEQYCDPQFFSYPDLRNTFQAAGIPCLMLETGDIAMPLGQIRSRVQAFLEILQEG